MRFGILLIVFLFSGCSLATELHELRRSPPTVKQTISGSYRPLARCTFEALEAKAEGTHSAVYQLRESDQPPFARVAAFAPSMDYYVVALVASISASFDVLFTPVETNKTAVEFRAAWPVGDDHFTNAVLPLIQLCSRQQLPPTETPR